MRRTILSLAAALAAAGSALAQAEDIPEAGPLETLVILVVILAVIVGIVWYALARRHGTEARSTWLRRP